jgi:cytochrome c oxidase subunit 3
VTTATGHPPHPSHLAHHFSSPEQQLESGKLGMWIFLATEVLLFSGLFCAYAVYRANHPEVFVYAHHFLDTKLGALNTAILLCSSFTMAWAVRCAQIGRRRGLIVLLTLTVLGGLGFMSVKYVEYEHKWRDGLLWGTRYHPEGHGEAPGAATGPADAPPAERPAPVSGLPSIVSPSDRPTIPPSAAGPAGTVEETPGAPAWQTTPDAPRNVHWFFGIYFLMTGLHGLHVLAGLGAITWLIVRAARGHFSAAYYTPVDLVGLYWHLVDMIWIFLFPLLYLIH